MSLVQVKNKIQKNKAQEGLKSNPVRSYLSEMQIHKRNNDIINFKGDLNTFINTENLNNTTIVRLKLVGDILKSIEEHIVRQKSDIFDTTIIEKLVTVQLEIYKVILIEAGEEYKRKLKVDANIKDALNDINELIEDTNIYEYYLHKTKEEFIDEKVLIRNVNVVPYMDIDYLNLLFDNRYSYKKICSIVLIEASIHKIISRILTFISMYLKNEHMNVSFGVPNVYKQITNNIRHLAIEHNRKMNTERTKLKDDLITIFNDFNKKIDKQETYDILTFRNSLVTSLERFMPYVFNPSFDNAESIVNASIIISIKHTISKDNNRTHTGAVKAVDYLIEMATDIKNTFNDIKYVAELSNISISKALNDIIENVSNSDLSINDISINKDILLVFDEIFSNSMEIISKINE